MADNIDISPGAGATVRTEDRSGTHTQVVVLDVGGTNGERMAGSTVKETDYALWVENRPRVVRQLVTPTISTAVYASGDCLGGLMEITGAARSAGGSGTLLAANLLDKSQAQRAAMDLVFFDRSVAVAGDNAPFATSDADMEHCLGTIPLLSYNQAWPGTPANSFATGQGVHLFYVANGTSLYCQAVVRGTPTYTSTSDLVFSFIFQPD